MTRTTALFQEGIPLGHGLARPGQNSVSTFPTEFTFFSGMQVSQEKTHNYLGLPGTDHDYLGQPGMSFGCHSKAAFNNNLVLILHPPGACLNMFSHGCMLLN
jgi:hypothetical protein